jgi:hypothetical protein
VHINILSPLALPAGSYLTYGETENAIRNADNKALTTVQTAFKTLIE